jgi:hypothetical protein
LTNPVNIRFDFHVFAESVSRSLAEISQAQAELNLAVRRLERK